MASSLSTSLVISAHRHAEATPATHVLHCPTAPQTLRTSRHLRATTVLGLLCQTKLAARLARPPSPIGLQASTTTAPTALHRCPPTALLTVTAANSVPLRMLRAVYLEVGSDVRITLDVPTTSTTTLARRAGIDHQLTVRWRTRLGKRLHRLSDKGIVIERCLRTERELAPPRCRAARPRKPRAAARHPVRMLLAARASTLVRQVLVLASSQQVGNSGGPRKVAHTTLITTLALQHG